MASLKKNVIYSTLLTTANYIFPIITFPYVSRVLGVTNVGIVNFVDSIVNYFVLFAMMGINTVAIREIASCKNNRQKLSGVFTSLFLLNLIVTVLMIALLIIATLAIPRLYENKELMLVGAFKLLFNALLVEWLYRGLEEFKYITIRTLIVRALFVVSVFIFVRDINDYVIYYGLVSSTIVINGIINLVHSRNYLSPSLRNINIFPFIKGFLILGVYKLLTSMYTTFNVSFLGFEGGDTEVGYYATATKLHSIILAMFTAFTCVMLPRMSSLITSKNKTDFKSYFDKSIKILFSFSFPLICFCSVYSDLIISSISGKGYELAVPCMQIIMPLIFIIGYEQILVIQILMPLKKDKAILANSIIGAMVGLLTNFLLVPYYVSIGSSMVWLISEISVLVSAQFFVHKYTNTSFYFKRLFKYLLYSMPIILILIMIHESKLTGIVSLLIGGTLTAIYFSVLEIYVEKNVIIISALKHFLKKQTNY